MYELASESKESDWKRGSTHRKGEKTVLSASGGPEMELAPLWDMVHITRQNGIRPSQDSLGRKLRLMPAGERVSSLLTLQRTHGNRYVQGLIAQAKLRVGQAGDRYEQEADLIADRVISMPGSGLHGLPGSRVMPPAKISTLEPASGRITILQGQNEHMEYMGLSYSEENGYGRARRGHLPLEEQVLHLKGSGHPLPDSVRNFFEPRFGRDFSQVRVHTDDRAAQSAKSLNAVAFTVGSHVVFNSGQYAPFMDTGKRLMAHELAHVVQQDGNQRSIQRQARAPSPAGGQKLVDASTQPVVRIVVVELSLIGLVDAIREKVRGRVQNDLKLIMAAGAGNKRKARPGFEAGFSRSMADSKAKAFGQSSILVYMVGKDDPQRALDLARKHLAIEKRDERMMRMELAGKLSAKGGACAISGQKKVCFVDMGLFVRLSRVIFSEVERAAMDEAMGVHIGQLMLHELGSAIARR